MKTEKEIVVRDATSEDANEIADVLTSTKLDMEAWCGNRAFVAENLQKFLKKKQLTVLVAELNSSIVGFISCSVFPSFWECQKQGLIVDLFVHPAYQGKGVGSKLLETLVKKADVENIAELHVSTEGGNIKAQKLYRKLGFTGEQFLLERTQRR